MTGFGATSSFESLAADVRYPPISAVRYRVVKRSLTIDMQEVGLGTVVLL